MVRRLLSIAALVAALVALVIPAVAAQDATTVKTSDNPALGTIFTDPDGMTLYIFLKDTPNSGESTCYDKCAENWPPFTAKEPLTLPSGVPGALGTITRTDGSTQVTYHGWPLYYFAKDKEAGDTYGQDVGDVWYVAVPAEGDATPMAEGEAAAASPMASPMAATTTVSTMDSADLGTYLTDPKGMTLYMFTKDTPGSGKSVCNDKCAENWPPYMAQEPLTLPEGVPGELSMITRDDGSMQVAYNGMPLYYYVKDEKPGDTTGQDVGDVWYVVNPSAPGASTPTS
jgi:predicted lipoprotein with Yx(FWY)xxD motif